MSEQTPPGSGVPGQAAAGEGPGRDLPAGAVRVTVRRAPRYAPFVVTGVVLGVVAGLVLAFAFGDPAQTEQLSRATLARYFAAVLGLLGAVLGAAVALLLERRRR